MTACSKVDFLAELIGVKPRTWRTRRPRYPYCFTLVGVEVKSGYVLVSEYGKGASPLKAKHDYATNISGRVLVVNATSDRRREYLVPKLT